MSGVPLRPKILVLAGVLNGYRSPVGLSTGDRVDGEMELRARACQARDDFRSVDEVSEAGEKTSG